MEAHQILILMLNNNYSNLCFRAKILKNCYFQYATKIKFKQQLVVMSQTILPNKDEGYTSPDFLANLFKKPLYSPISLSSIHSLSDQQNPSGYKQNCSSPLLDSTNNTLKAKSQNRVYRSLSIIDDEKIQSKKYKIFFKTFMHGRVSEEQLSQLWKELQCSFGNPFQFDKLIESIKEKRQLQISKQLQQKNLQKVQASQSMFRNEKKRSKSNERNCHHQRSFQKYLSPQKRTDYKQVISGKTKRVEYNLDPFQKHLITKQIISIKHIIIKNQNKIRQKAL